MQKDAWVLTRPTAADEAELTAFAAEFFQAGERPIWGGSHLGEEPFPAWLARVTGTDVPEGRVPQTTFLLRDGQTPRVYGIGAVRHQLSDALRSAGGHIGYSIRPSERGRGLGSLQLGLLLKKCAQLGIERALVTCDKSNAASAATALSQGGVEDAPSLCEDGSVLQRRFWLESRRV